MVGNLDEFVKHYEMNLEKYRSFERDLKSLLERLLNGEQIEFFAIESRCKTVDRIREKALRKDYEDPLSQMTDIVGLRVIVYYANDADRVVRIIRRYFFVDEEKSRIDKYDPNNIDRFGYKGTHLIVGLSDERSRLPEWQRYADLKAEIQVRTVLEHAWASVSHQLFYKPRKPNPQLPPAAMRRLNRAMALLETVDEEFVNLRGSVEEAAVATEGQFEADPGGATMPSLSPSKF